jgi:hypothetical protein
MLEGLVDAQDFGKARLLPRPERGQTKSRQVEGSLRFDATAKALLFTAKDGKDILSTSYASIRALNYERAATPRYWSGIFLIHMLLFTREKKHFLTIQYGAESSGQYALLRLDKNNFRHVLAMLESETGKKVNWIEEY